VRYVLEGSVRRSANQIRINAQLIDAQTDVHLWAERFDGDTSDLFALQDEVTSRIAVALNIELVTAEAARFTENSDALDYMLRARAELLKPQSRDNYAAAINLLDRALTLDPRSVEVQSRLATALAARVIDERTDTAAVDILRAEDLAGQALAAAPRSTLAHFAKGQVLRAQRRPEQAISEYEAVLALDRNWVSAYSLLGWCKLWTGSVEEAIPLQEQAIRLSPRDPQIGIWHRRIGMVHLLQSRFDDAIIWFEKSSGRGLPHLHSRLASAYALKGETERAIAELAEARTLSYDERYSSIDRLKVSGYRAAPKIQALLEATYFAGLRKAGMPEE